MVYKLVLFNYFQSGNLRRKVPTIKFLTVTTESPCIFITNWNLAIDMKTRKISCRKNKTLYIKVYSSFTFSAYYIYRVDEIFSSVIETPVIAQKLNYITRRREVYQYCQCSPFLLLIAWIIMFSAWLMKDCTNWNSMQINAVDRIKLLCRFLTPPALPSN